MTGRSISAPLRNWRGSFSPAREQPLALQLAARLPIEHRLVSEVRNRHLLVLVEREIRHERAVRHDDDLALLELVHRAS